MITFSRANVDRCIIVVWALQSEKNASKDYVSVVICLSGAPFSYVLFYSNRCLTHWDNSSCKSYRCRTWMANCRTACAVMGQGTRMTESARMNVILISKFVWRNTCVVSLRSLGLVVLELDLRPYSEGIHLLRKRLWGMKNPGLSCLSALPGRWVHACKIHVKWT